MIITSKANAKVKHIVKLYKDKKYRKECKEAVFEGEVVFKELRDKVSLVLCSEDKKDLIEGLSEDVAFIVSDFIMEDISDVKKPQGIIFTIAIDDMDVNDLEKGKYILFDGISDPGNLGTVIRTAAAFGIDGIILSKDSCDFTSPKVIRSTMGNVFAVKIYYTQLEIAIEKLKSLGISVYATNLSETSMDIKDISLSNSAVIIGNEANGVSSKVLALVDKHIIIPMTSGTESLNAAVASSIVMWEMSK